MRDSKMQAMALAGVGIGFMVELGMFTLLGWWVDGRLGTRPWLMVTGVVLGLAYALHHLLRIVERWEAAEHDDDGAGESRR